MAYIFIALLLGINLAPFLLSKLDFWHAQGLFVQGGILIIFSLSFFLTKRFVSVKNIPLGILNLWVGGQILVISFMSQAKGKYDVTHFFPYFNFLCLMILYKLVLDHLQSKDVEKIMKWMKIAVLVTLFVCVLQYFNLGQFFRLLFPDDKYRSNTVFGFIGNGTHLSGFLGTSIPLFLVKPKRVDWLSLALMATVMMFTGTAINDPAISGYIIGILLSLYVSFRVNRKIFWFLLSGYIAIAAVCAAYFWDAQFFNSNGRLGFWKYYWKLYMKFPVTGWGLGHFNSIYQLTPYPEGRHLHMEFYHFLFECGAAGLVLALYLIKDFFDTSVVHPLGIYIKAYVLGFLLSCCFNFPAHLWLPSTWAMFMYASYYVIKNNEVINGQLQKRD